MSHRREAYTDDTDDTDDDSNILELEESDSLFRCEDAIATPLQELQSLAPAAAAVSSPPGPLPIRPSFADVHNKLLHLRWPFVFAWVVIFALHFGAENFPSYSADQSTHLFRQEDLSRVFAIDAARLFLATTALMFMIVRRNTLLSWFGATPVCFKNYNVAFTERRFHAVWMFGYSIHQFDLIMPMVCLSLSSAGTLAKSYPNDVGTFSLFRHLDNILFGFAAATGVLAFVYVQLPARKSLEASMEIVGQCDLVTPGVKNAFDCHFSKVRRGLKLSPPVVFRALALALAVVVSVGILLLQCLLTPYWERSFWLFYYSQPFIEYDSCADSLQHNLAFPIFFCIGLCTSTYTILMGPIWTLWTMWELPLKSRQLWTERLTDLLVECQQASEHSEKLSAMLQAQRLFQATVVKPIFDVANIMVSVSLLASVAPIFTIIQVLFLNDHASDVTALIWFNFSLSLAPLGFGLIVWLRALPLIRSRENELHLIRRVIRLMNLCPNRYSESRVRELHAAVEFLQEENVCPRVFWMEVGAMKIQALFGVGPVVSSIITFGVSLFRKV
eukprot:m.179946 g.179946  ORF g.179946 m.179946 type:complete len:558 (-) comp21454_c0_seq1:38-1711(-)